MPIANQSSNRSELDRLMEQYGSSLLRMSAIYLKDADLAQDAVQETFIKAYRHMNDYRGDSSEKTWLTSICVNTCRDILRTAWFRHTSRMDLDTLPERPADFKFPDNTVLTEVMRLPVKYREVILLRYYEGLKLKEVADGFGILEYHPDQSANQAYVDNIMTLNQTWDGKYFSATIHEAVFDGMKMTFTMSISPKENADPVFVIPRITAISGGKELHTFTTHSSVFMDDGFWVPCMEPDVIYDYDHIGVDVILTDDFVTFNPVEDQVEWSVSFDVLHTDWPIDYTTEDEPMIGEPEWTDSDYEKYEHQFVKAYEEKRVLLNQAAMLSPFADAVPHDPSMEDEMAFPDYLETLLTQDAFTIEEKFVFSFTADPLPVKHEKQSVNFETPNGLLARVESLSVSVDQIGIKLRITRPDSDQPLQLVDWQGWLIAVLAQGAETSSPESNYGPEEDGSLHYNMHWTITGETNQLILIPVEDEFYSDVIKNQGAVTEEQQARMVYIDLE